MVDGSVKFISETIDTGDASVSGMGINTPTPQQRPQPLRHLGRVGHPGRRRNPRRVLRSVPAGPSIAAPATSATTR